MASSETHELAVRIRTEGAQESQDDLDGVDDAFQDVASQTEESAGLLSDFSEKFAGAMSVAVAGLGVAAAGILSQVPILSEAFGALGALVNTAALLIDETLRPVLQPVTIAIFAFADAVLQTQGPLRDLLGILTTVGVVGGVILSVLSLLGVTLSGPIILAVLAIVGAVALLSKAWESNFLGIRNITMSVVSFVSGFINEFLSAIIEGRWFEALGAMLKFSGSILLRLVEAFDKFKATVRTIVETLGELVIMSLKSMANRALSTLEGLVNRAISAIPSMIRTKLGIGQVSLPRFDTQSAGQIVSGGGQRLNRRFAAAEERRRSRENDLGQQVERVVQALQNSEQTTTVELDGREVARNQEQFLAGGAANVGRVSRTR